MRIYFLQSQHYPSSLTQSVTKEETRRGKWTELTIINYILILLVKTDFIQALLSILENLSCGELKFSRRKSIIFFPLETECVITGAFDNSGNKYFNPPMGTKVKASTFSIPGFCLISPEAEHWDKLVYAWNESHQAFGNVKSQTKGSPEEFLAVCQNGGDGGTDKASFSLILCAGRVANKATSNLHTTWRPIFKIPKEDQNTTQGSNGVQRA